MPTLAITETATSNTFTAIASDEESYDEGSRSEQEEVEEYSNDPLDQHNQIEKSPTQKPKKEEVDQKRVNVRGLHNQPLAITLAIRV